MGKIIKKRIEYGGSSNSAENIKYDDTKNVKEAINEVDNLLGNTDISAIGDGTVTGGLNALNSNLIILEASTQVLMTANRELDDSTEAITIPSGYKPIAMYAYNSNNNDNVSAVPLLIRSDGRVLYHAKNHSASDQGTIQFVIRITFKRM